MVMDQKHLSESLGPKTLRGRKQKDLVDMTLIRYISLKELGTFLSCTLDLDYNLSFFAMSLKDKTPIE